MDTLIRSLKAFKQQVILIAGGKDKEDFEYERYTQEIIKACKSIGACRRK